MIKSFRGQLQDGEFETIRLSTNNGMVGYAIKKFQLMPLIPGQFVQELVCKLYSVEQTAATGSVGFDDPTLLAAAVYSQHSDSWPTATTQIIFDSNPVNQDIFITLRDSQGAAGAQGSNYYVELEQFKLDLSEATVATLKDMRAN
tara:strand:- start:511 stop:945 length:435 start_codon:yes stop_codon:yes gene_type:complete